MAAGRGRPAGVAAETVRDDFSEQLRAMCGLAGTLEREAGQNGANGQQQVQGVVGQLPVTRKLRRRIRRLRRCRGLGGIDVLLRHVDEAGPIWQAPRLISVCEHLLLRVEGHPLRRVQRPGVPDECWEHQRPPEGAAPPQLGKAGAALSNEPWEGCSLRVYGLTRPGGTQRPTVSALIKVEGQSSAAEGVSCRDEGKPMPLVRLLLGLAFRWATARNQKKTKLVKDVLDESEYDCAHRVCHNRMCVRPTHVEFQKRHLNRAQNRRK